MPSIFILILFLKRVISAKVVYAYKSFSYNVSVVDFVMYRIQSAVIYSLI